MPNDLYASFDLSLSAYSINHEIVCGHDIQLFLFIELLPLEYFKLNLFVLRLFENRHEKYNFEIFNVIIIATFLFHLIV